MWEYEVLLAALLEVQDRIKKMARGDTGKPLK